MSQEQTILLRKIVDALGTGSGGTYNVTPPTYTDGGTVTPQYDVNGNQKVVEQYAPGYEDNTANRALVEQRKTPYNITASATISIMKSTAGFLHITNVGMVSAPTITIYDNASGASGTILAHIEPKSEPGFYV